MNSASEAQAQDQWFQEAAASQIKGERLVRAELLNGRVAMLGFVIGVATEAITGHGILSQITFGVLGLN
ncbi:chlorophyll a/b-binding protein [Synechococcus sp. NOUM97013]|uniref:chlorophyll a/b-binding protein n=1 Tax=Synechococcus sp. NOUM97013 TaxID=1442555 RepID=UPI001645E68E|nr:chlorophyll a/b-binding protein [Synechococcus sp. NOUM97013]QNI73848.1 high light inducible protein [Synechococcus sp. NOUM97013]